MLAVRTSVVLNCSLTYLFILFSLVVYVACAGSQEFKCL